MKKVFLSLIILAMALSGISQERKLDNTFYCFNNGVRGLPNAPETPGEQAALIKKLGFDGLAGHHSQDNIVLRMALDREDLLMPEVYYGITLDESGNILIPDKLLDLIKQSKGRDLLVALTLHAEYHLDKKDEADQKFIEAIQELAYRVSRYNVDIAIYPHVDLYCEASMHALELALAVDRKNVGVIFNTCHFLKVEGEEGWADKLEKSLPLLRMVSINGADSGDTKSMGWDQLIQPLGEGSIDTYKLVKFLKDKGYEGLFGLQCYGI